MACACKGNKSSSAPKPQVRRTSISSNGKVTSSTRRVMRREIKWLNNNDLIEIYND